jgi:hypothetical protein
MNATVTYSPEDNKLRLYVGRVPRDEYEALRKAGFVSTPKQDCDFAVTWTPEREDMAAEYLEDGEDIGDEDYSPLERSADRAERFEGYREKRADEAGGAADTFAAGPGTFGHQNLARAERQARRHDRHRNYAVGQWSKAEYWQQRTEGVIAHALYRSCPRVRRGRILTLETELRRMGERTDERGLRWKAHYELRLTYERAMLANEGGSASEADMEPGGWICTANRTGSVFTDVKEGWKQIQGVNKSPVTGRVVSVKVCVPHTGFTRASGYKNRETQTCMVTVNIERLAEGAYRAPTDEERATFAAETAERKATEKAGKPKEPTLINPTDEDAERLQAIWNARAKEAHIRRGAYGDCPVMEVWRMTQAAYSARSKGDYSPCRTTEISERLEMRRNFGSCTGRVTVFKIRTGGGTYYEGAKVVILTDKPQKPLPWDAVEKAAALQPTTDSLFYRLGDIAQAMEKWDHDGDERQLLEDARYVGWVNISSATQKHWTEAGVEALRKFEEIKAEGGRPVEHGTLFSMVGV